MKNKGFTLIELLAVIVILAIIALIATPVILNIIDDSRKSSEEQSLNMYGKAVEQAIAKKFLNDSTYVIEEGEYIYNKDDKCLKLNIDGDCIIDIEYDGEVPDIDKINITKNGSVNFKTTLSDGTEYTYGSSDVTQGTPTVPEGKICAAMDSSKSASTTVGTEYFCQVSDTESHNFYVLGTSTDGTKVNLLMKENLKDNVVFFDAPYTSDLWSLQQSEFLNEVDVFDELNEWASGWSNLTNYNETFESQGIATTLTGKARLPKYEEISNLCPNEGEANLDYWGYETQPHRYGCPIWLTSTSYWTMDLVPEFDIGYPGVWAVSSKYKTLDDFGLIHSDADYLDLNCNWSSGWCALSEFGIRPVITVNVSDLS